MSSHGERAPRTELGLLDATMIGMGAMIGAGIFVLTGLAADVAGPAAVVVFGLNGVVTAFTGLSYAELASAIPKNGGGYAFVREIFADLTSFLMGWLLWFAYMIAGALYALGFAPNVLELLAVYGLVAPPGEVGAVALPVVGVGVPVRVGLASAAVASLVALNAVSTGASGDVETIADVTGELDIVQIRVAQGAPAAGKELSAVRLPAGALVISDDDGERIARPDTTLTPGKRYVVAVEPDVADEVLNLLRG